MDKKSKCLQAFQPLNTMSTHIVLTGPWSLQGEVEHCALQQTCACRHVLLTLQLSVFSVAMLFSWPHPFFASDWLRLQRTRPFTVLWRQNLGRWERRTFYFNLPPGSQSTLLVSEFPEVSYKNDSFKPKHFLCRDSKLLQRRCEHCAISSPSISISHWICSFVPLLKVPMYIPFCNYISGNCKQLDWMPEWAQWVQDSLLQTCRRPNNTPCRLTACSKRLTYSNYPEKQMLILSPTKVQTLYAGSHLKSSKGNAFSRENMFLTSKKYFSVTMQDKALRKGLALWFIIFFYERIAWKR